MCLYAASVLLGTSILGVYNLQSFFLVLPYHTTPTRACHPLHSLAALRSSIPPGPVLLFLDKLNYYLFQG